MKMLIQTPDFKASDKLIDFVTENVEKLGAISDRILEAQVVLKKEKSATNDNRICELKLVIPGNDIFASRQGATFESAVMETVDAVKHQIKRWRDSQDAGKRRGTAPVILEEEESEDET
jgi:ribosome-associated translation inhibitor RaiA